MCGFPEYRGALVGGSAQAKPGCVLCQAFNREGSLGAPSVLRGDGQRMGGHFSPSSLAMAEWHLLCRLTPPAHPTCHCGVESYFESWRLTGNSSPSNTRPHWAVDPPFSSGGAREGLGVRVGLQRKNCYIVDSCLRRYSKGYRPKTPLTHERMGR